MERYTIYCTEEQTKKALELGAPIKGCNSPYSPKMWVAIKGATYEIPTTEQMIGWLEEQENIHNINVTGNECRHTWKYDIYLNMPDGYDWLWAGNFSSRKEAIFAAIDTALEYLIKNK